MFTIAGGRPHRTGGGGQTHFPGVMEKKPKTVGDWPTMHRPISRPASPRLTLEYPDAAPRTEFCDNRQGHGEEERGRGGMSATSSLVVARHFGHT